MNQSDTHQLNLLFDAYVENALTLEESTQLCDWLRQNEAAVDHFVVNSYLHSQLFELARQKSLRSDALQQPESMGDHVVRAGAVTPSTRAVAPATALLGRYLLLASCFAATMAILWWGFLSAPVVAQISELSADVAWAGDEPGPAAGDLLREGRRLELTRGRVVTTLVSGARLVVVAPATLRITQRNSISLESGQIGAAIPRQATGFQIDTTLGRFVDLGTEFTLNLVDARKCQLMVFRGLVELQPSEDAKGGPLRVPQGRAVSYDADNGEVVVLPYDEQLRGEL